MATVVLTVAGGFIGGPAGAAIGAQLGASVDRAVLFKPKGREGPRLQELRVQTSSYGTPIARLFGTMRVAGSVIWATELAEHASTEGGKGRPSVTSYRYTASFAVALSGRPIAGVGRIWADGKLLRGAAGDWKAACRFRLHLGGEDQAPDPLIAAAEGAGLAPAHRGIAYAVFEDLELADFGNRIPSLSFEVIADPAPVPAGDVLAALAPEIACAADTPALDGFAAQGSSVRAVAEMLAGAAGGWFRSDAGRLALLAGDGPAETVADAGAGRGARGSRAIAAADSAPRTVTLSHYDPARDYQAGVQRAARPGAGMREARIELPAAIGAGAAKSIAEATLARLDLEREARSVALPWHALTIRPGERVTIAGVAGSWRVVRWTLEAMVVTLDCVAIAPATVTAAASGGRVLAAPDLALGRTVLHAFELPLLGAPADVPQIGIAAAGTEPGWRGAALLASGDGGARWDMAGRTAAPAVLGRVTAPPGAGPAQIEDRRNSLVVTLAHAGMVLGDAEPAELAAGANLAMAGDELIQFASAEPLGGTAWRLRGLWRGRRGTEFAIGTQAAGDRFVLVTAATLATLPLAVQAGTVHVLAEGVGDEGAAAEALAAVTGLSIVPPTPVHLAAVRQPGGAALLRWVRRSRAGWDWIDGVDVPIGEERERYHVTIGTADGGAWSIETEVPWLLLDAAQRAQAVSVAVRQIGSHGVSRPALLQLEEE